MKKKKNKAFEDNKLEDFIKKTRKKNEVFKLTPMIIYYGNEDNNQFIIFFILDIK